MANRILAAIARTKTQIVERLANGLVTQQRIDDLNQSLNMDLLEYVKFQEIKSFAFACGKLNLEEASAIYAFLGNTPDHFNGNLIEVKSVLTKIFAELLVMKIKGNL